MIKQFISVVITFTILYTAIPQNLSYQGLLTNPDGTIVTDGDYEITFIISHD